MQTEFATYSCEEQKSLPSLYVSSPILVTLRECWEDDPDILHM